MPDERIGGGKIRGGRRARREPLQGIGNTRQHFAIGGGVQFSGFWHCGTFVAPLAYREKR
jgi:hypothetical protein